MSKKMKEYKMLSEVKKYIEDYENDEGVDFSTIEKAYELQLDDFCEKLCFSKPKGLYDDGENIKEDLHSDFEKMVAYDTPTRGEMMEEEDDIIADVMYAIGENSVSCDCWLEIENFDEYRTIQDANVIDYDKVLVLMEEKIWEKRVHIIND